MPSDDVKFEIGHVLFIDIVGYSKLLMHEQSEQLQKLKEIVRGTEEFRLAEAEGKLLRLPTGDGGALVFRNSSEAPVKCAMEIANALKNHPQLQVRMGIHSGPVNDISDLNEQANIAGAGINIAQRVMDCGDAGHILLSKHVAEDLEHFARWQPYLHDIGECEVKHGRTVSLVNFYDDQIGNSELPAKCSPVLATIRSETRFMSRLATVSAVAVLLFAVVAVLLIAAGVIRFASRPPANTKSIAVLPFENLSREPENAYFADGIQEEILTRLSKIADLKVISRTSTQRYKSAPSNLSEIAQRLGVANILEGSVQKAGDQVRVNVQLINARSDAHLWADRFDRKLTDIFAVETDIATKIADILQAKLTGNEQQAIAARPTNNSEAHELYLKGRYVAARRDADALRKSINYFNQAIEKDPNYALAYTGLADSYALLPQYSVENPNECFTKARAAVAEALALDPSLPEAHTSLGFILSDNELNLKDGQRELEQAIALNPNSANAHYFLGISVFDRVGKTDAAITEVKRAAELDPLSPIVNANLATCYIHARRYSEAITQARKTVELEPNFFYGHGVLGEALFLNGDFAAGIAEYENAYRLRPGVPPLAYMAAAYALKGDHEKVKSTVARAMEQEKSDGSPFYYGRAVISLALGDKAAAVENLEKSYEAKENGPISEIKVDPLLDPLRGDQRFEKLVNKVVPPDS